MEISAILLADHVEQVHVYEPDEENDLRKYLSYIPEEGKARNTNLDLKSYIKQDLFATTKFVTGLKVMELGQPPSLKVLSYFLGITDTEERALKWSQIKKWLVRELI